MFPVDWNEWKSEWHRWEANNVNRLLPSNHYFGPMNVLADAVLGTYKVNGRDVELSEVVFSMGEAKRMIGITFSDGNGNTVVDSFRELESVLGIY